MLVPLSWLAEMVEIRGSAQEVCELLTSSGIETEIAEDQRPDWTGVVTAELKAVERHPDADRLTVTRPFDGTTEYQVVCGATNHKAGDVVALATVGTRLPNGLKIKKGKMRGQVSQGMLCSEAELGLSAEAAGILILPPGTPLGRPLADVMPSGDVVLETEPTANRGDCLSILGTARELAAVSGWPVKGRASADSDDDEGLETIQYDGPSWAGNSGVVGAVDRAVSVHLDSSAGCPRYACAILEGVSIGPSPKWIQDRLEAMGVRAINNVVDCTNYVMLELGNPLHAFDRRFVRGGEVRIRLAQDGEAATTLDGAEHTLVDDDLVITDAEGVIAIAGVMGGENSEVREDTTTLLLESAHFAPATVRRTAHRLKLGTESSYRFARGVDPELPVAALLRLIELLQLTAGGELDGAILDLYPTPVERPRVSLREERIKGLLGLELEPAYVEQLLTQDGLTPVRTPTGWDVDAPSYRFDVEREVDVLEEIVRLHGYDKIPESLPARALRSVPRQPQGLDIEGLRDSMVRLGLSESIHFSFIDPQWLEKLGLPEDHLWRARSVTVENPLSEVGGILRPALIPSLLAAASRNVNHGAQDVRLFELRNTFLARPDGFSAILQGDGARPSDRPPVLETRKLAGILLGHRSPGGWHGDSPNVDLFDVKLAVTTALDLLGSKGFRWSRDGDLPVWLDPSESALLVRPGREVQIGGVIGRVAVPVLRAFEIDRVVYAFEIDLPRVAPKRSKQLKFQPFSRFPGAERDLAVVVPDTIAAEWAVETAAKAARKAAKDAFRGAAVFDVYRGPGVPPGARSIALRLRFRSNDRTLEDRAVDSAMAQVEKQLTSRDGVVLRG